MIELVNDPKQMDTIEMNEMEVGDIAQIVEDFHTYLGDTIMKVTHNTIINLTNHKDGSEWIGTPSLRVRLYKVGTIITLRIV